MNFPVFLRYLTIFFTAYLILSFALWPTGDFLFSGPSCTSCCSPRPRRFIFGFVGNNGVWHFWFSRLLSVFLFFVGSLVSLWDAYVAQSVEMVFEILFSFKGNVFCCTLMILNGLSDLRISLLYVGRFVLLAHCAISTHVMASLRKLTSSFWKPESCTLVCRSRVFLTSARCWTCYLLFVSWEAISKTDGFAVCGKIHRRIHPIKLPTESLMFRPQMDIVTVLDWMATLSWIVGPEIYTHV